ncbi:hypothetical protein DNL40_14780 [Xylanimonas oleitrophica]|uniref:Uncharacterized protein n=1 Tax=Xylanimonas oleitrophica TaxID=2607479 RepID=A0A2W5WMC6_9MICO|nr:hypothetical protein [Xylanimonas oleitrophica]PZR51873.1 hypothetical protein DNL40_14780 [Xylanimonas oleitrophica]
MLLVLLAWIVLDQQLTHDALGYARADRVAIQAAGHTVWIVLAVTVVAALAGAQWRAARWAERTAARPAAARLLDALWPALVVGAVGAGAATALTAATLGSVGRVEPRPYVTLLLFVVAAATTGLAVGLRLPPAFAVVVAPVMWFVPLAFAPVMETPWPRHLVSMTWCCGVDTTTDPRVYAANALCATSLAVAGHLGARGATRPRPPLGEIVGAGGAVVCGLAGAVAVALPLGHSPHVVRDEALHCRDGVQTSIRYCYFPEEAAAAPAAIAEADALFSAVERRTGVELPHSISQRPDRASGERPMDAVPARRPPQEQGHGLLALAAFPTVPDDCWDALPGGTGRSVLSEDVAVVERTGRLWWEAWARSVRPGEPTVDTELRAAAERLRDGQVPRPLLDHLFALTPAEQGRWVSAAQAAVESCDTASMEHLLTQGLR